MTGHCVDRVIETNKFTGVVYLAHLSLTHFVDKLKN